MCVRIGAQSGALQLVIFEVAFAAAIRQDAAETLVPNRKRNLQKARSTIVQARQYSGSTNLDALWFEI